MNDTEILRHIRIGEIIDLYHRCYGCGAKRQAELAKAPGSFGRSKNTAIFLEDSVTAFFLNELFPETHTGEADSGEVDRCRSGHLKLAEGGKMQCSSPTASIPMLCGMTNSSKTTALPLQKKAETVTIGR